MQYRPVEITNFIRHYDLSKVTIPNDPVEYGLRWIAWWRSLQPKWRIRSDSDIFLNNEDYIPEKPDWTKLSIAGKGGIVLVLIGLSIWSISIRRHKCRGTASKDLQIWIDDVDLVLQMMVVNWTGDEEATATA